MHFLPFGRWPFTKRKRPVNLTTVSRIRTADFGDQAVAVLQFPLRMKLRRNGKIRITHRHTAHEMDPRITALFQVNRLDEIGDLVFPNPSLEALGNGPDGIVGELRGETDPLDLFGTSNRSNRTEPSPEIRK